MAKIQKFNFQDHQLRGFLAHNTSWIYAKDILEILGNRSNVKVVTDVESNTLTTSNLENLLAVLSIAIPNVRDYEILITEYNNVAVSMSAISKIILNSSSPKSEDLLEFICTRVIPQIQQFDRIKRYLEEAQKGISEMNSKQEELQTNHESLKKELGQIKAVLQKTLSKHQKTPNIFQKLFNR
jgi:prophage antirepressor-like protein